MKLNLLKVSVVCAFLAGSINVQAQLVSSEVFLQGKYVEVGVTTNGDFGTTTAPPAGYHPHGVTGLGFVCDYGMDGWAVGTPPFMGDYFMPGSPFEGWELQIGSARCQAFNNGGGGYVGGLSGSGGNTSYAVSGSTITGIWQGMVDSVALTQQTIIDTNNLYFTVKVTLTNLSYFPKNNLYYLRSLDPDNDASWPGGGFTTNNVVEHQAVDTTVVSATGLSGTYTAMSLGTTDTAALAFAYDAWPLSSTVDLATIYSQTFGPASYAQGVNDPGDIGIGLLFSIAHLATVDSAGDSVSRTTALARKHPANSATISYFYAFTNGGMDAAINAAVIAKKSDTVVAVTNPGALGVQNVNANNNINVYPNPAKNVLNISGLGTGDQLSIYDMMGHRILQITAANASGVHTLSMNNIATGAYILVVSDASGNVRARVPVRKM
jgi:type IX secretion system substrate protein